MPGYQDFGNGGHSNSRAKLEAIGLPENLSGMSILDLGCNEGYFCKIAVERGARRVLGIDRDPVAIEQARVRVPQAEFIVDSWWNIPNERFDYILLLSALHYERSQKALLGRISYALAESGTLILECGTARLGDEKAYCPVSRFDGVYTHPTEQTLRQDLLSCYAVRTHGRSVDQPGDQVPRYVFHCGKRRPVIFVIGGDSYAGKTAFGDLFRRAAIKVLSTDIIMNDAFEGRLLLSSGFTEYLKSIYRDGELSLMTEKIVNHGQGPEFARFLLSFVSPSDDLTVFEGFPFLAPEIREAFEQSAEDACFEVVAAMLRSRDVVSRPVAAEEKSDMSSHQSANEFAAAVERHNGHNYLAPQDLQTSEPILRRLLLVGSCLGEQWGFHKSNEQNCPGDYVFTNNFGQLPEQPPQPVDDYDLQIVQIATRSILNDRALWALPFDDISGHEQLFRDACERLEAMLKAQMVWNVRTGLLTFVANFHVPQQNSIGRLQPRYDLRNPVYFFEELNRRLYELTASYKNAYIIDLDAISTSFGRKFVQEDNVGWLAHSTYLPHLPADTSRIEQSRALIDSYPSKVETAMKAAWAEIMAMYRTIRQTDAVKLVVVDLDDTIWPGLIAERGHVGPEILDEPIWPMGVIEALGFLKKRGILIAIISKNDESIVRKAWETTVEGLLPLREFSSAKINWRPKAENMSEILSEVNVLSRNVLFVDDNPVERSAMQAQFPEIRVLDGFHYFWKRILLWSSETQAAHISAESGHRTEMVRFQIERERQRKSVAPDEFLVSLKLRISLKHITSSDDPDFQRAFELLNKVNQFNTTGRRWTLEECNSAFSRGTSMCVFSAEDRFTAYGLIGAVIIFENSVNQFVMSCRVAGLGVEDAALASIINGLSREREITAELNETDTNFICRTLYSRAGFSKKDELWLLPTDAVLSLPPHIMVRG